jgi:hypothetical protein
MTDLVAHYERVWDFVADDQATPSNGKTMVSAFVVHAVLDERPLANVLTQWEIDPQSVVEQSIRELLGFKACLPEYMRAPRQQGMPARAAEAFSVLADFFCEVASHEGAQDGLRELWRATVLELKAEAEQ